ncbi:MAG: class I SAM-dependent methyltransferase [Chloroflexi bacterium]|nr:MAG: class I SAM-dependent methyltransferase [Chloroflexota bacterium]
MEKQSRLQWIYSAPNDLELAARYDEWAEDYDTKLEQEFGWRGPERAVEFLSQYVPREARILDAGAGTGLVGKVLASLGYRNLVGLDLSPGMLEQAGRKGVYRELYQMVLGEPLDFPTNSFDAVISVGVLTWGHAPASSLDELVRLTRPGGYIVFTLRPDVYRECGFREKHAELARKGKWKLVEVSEEFQALPKGEPEVYHQVWVYQVL